MRVALVVVCLATSVAQADPAAVDLVKELHAIGGKVKVKDPPEDSFVQGATCTAVAKAERGAIEKRVKAWLDARHPDEKPAGTMDMAFVLNVGCKDPSGFVGVDVSQDRAPYRKSGGRGTRRNYVLRVFADKIEAVEESTSTFSDDWMEWADEGRLELVGQLDLDGDGKLDLLLGHYDHEGGASATSTSISVQFATGKTADIGRFENFTDVRLVKGQLVLAAEDKEQHIKYACLGSDLKLASCAASAGLVRDQQRRDIAARYAEMTADALPDHDLLITELAVLGAKASPAALAEAAATTPVQRAQRHVAAWLAKTGLRNDFDDVITVPHPEDKAYISGIEATLGDRACNPIPLTDLETAAATAWVKRQDEKLQRLTIEPAECGPYIWAAWERPGEVASMDDTEHFRREVLLSRDAKTRLLGLTSPPTSPEGAPEFPHTAGFVAHGDAIIGVVLHDKNLWIVAGGKVVLQSKGDVAPYSAGDAWSRSLFYDGGTLWHGIATGRERPDPTLTHDHDARAAARSLVISSDPSSDPKYVAALAELGADKALIAEAKALPHP